MAGAVQGVKGGAGQTGCLAAVDLAAALYVAAEQGTGGGADDGAGGAFAARVDGAADQRAAGGADDQTGGAVGTAAALAPLTVVPGAALIIAVVAGQRDAGHRGQGQ